MEAHTADTTHHWWCQEIQLSMSRNPSNINTHIVVWCQGQHIRSNYMRVLVSERVRTCYQTGHKCLSSQHALWAARNQQVSHSVSLPAHGVN